MYSFYKVITTSFSKFIGNDTIDRYPPPYEGKLTKLLCISKERFEKLKAALDEFGIKAKSASSKQETPLREKTLKKEPLAALENDDLKTDRDRCIGLFEPADIFINKSSDFWRLQNLNAWFKEQESYEDSRYLKSYAIEI